MNATRRQIFWRASAAPPRASAVCRDVSSARTGARASAPATSPSVCREPATSSRVSCVRPTPPAALRSTRLGHQGVPTRRVADMANTEAAHVRGAVVVMGMADMAAGTTAAPDGTGTTVGAVVGDTIRSTRHYVPVSGSTRHSVAQ